MSESIERDKKNLIAQAVTEFEKLFKKQVEVSASPKLRNYICLDENSSLDLQFAINFWSDNGYIPDGQCVVNDGLYHQRMIYFPYKLALDRIQEMFINALIKPPSSPSFTSGNEP